VLNAKATKVRDGGKAAASERNARAKTSMTSTFAQRESAKRTRSQSDQSGGDLLAF